MFAHGIKLYSLAVLAVVHAEKLASFSGMLSQGEAQQKQFMRLVSGLDKEVLSEEYRIHMVGDSTMRNQWSALCSLLNVKKLFEPTDLAASPQCVGEGWGSQRLIATGTFNRLKPILASQMPGILAAATKAYNVSKFDVIYFGSSALHFLQLLPARDLGDSFYLNAVNFESGISEMLQVVKSFTTCPIFQTMHYVCDDLYFGTWAKAFKENYYGDENNLRNICQKRVPQSVEVCMNFSFTSKGSITVAQIERRGIESANTAVGVVDTYALTYKQCWASSDGRHYLKPLPIFLKALSEQIYACQAGTVFA